jgi:hypothetical protein
MKASEYIAKLQALIEEHGDLECVTVPQAPAISACGPISGFRQIEFTAERTGDTFWSDETYHSEEEIGIRVITLE